LVTHINHALVPKTHPPLYMIHKYWARKPHNVVEEYIKHYTQRSDVVLDPFCGSGVTLIEALKNDRLAIGLDLDPISIMLMECSVEDVDSSDLEEAYKKVLADVKDEIDDLYAIKCPKCGNNKATIRYVVWSNIVICPECNKEVVMAEAKKPSGKKQNIYKCPHCKEEFSYANLSIIGETPRSATIDCDRCHKAHKVVNPKLKTPQVDFSRVWYPKIKFSYNGDKPFVTKRRASTIEELYTPRNLYALAVLFKAISEVPQPLDKFFKLIFSSMVPQASKMMIVTETQGPGWKMPEYLVWAVHCEFNVWSRFVNRYKTLRRGLENRKEIMQTTEVVNDFESLVSGQGRAFVKKQNALEITDIIPSDSVDYVFTDPPYGGSIQYYELDLLRASWLFDKDELEQWWKEEITINTRGQGKDFDYYHKMLSASFAQVYRVLKPNHYLTVTFHSTDIDVWNSIIMAVRLAGFELEKIIYQPPAKASARAMLSPYGSAIGDYYIRFIKPTRRKEVTEEQASKEKYYRVVIETTKKIIAERGEPTPFTFILNGIIPELDKQGVFFVDKRGSKGIEDVLKNRVDIDFVLKPILGKSGKPAGVSWWFKDPSTIPYLESVPLSERVEKLVINILNDRVKVSFDDVLQEVFIQFPNALTPNTQSVRMVLDEYATKTPDKKWMLKPRFKMRLREHDLIVGNLADFGRELGFNVHADLAGYRQTAFPFSTVNPNRVKEIDVIYYSKNNANAIFEVENTTGITEAIVRSGNIPDPELLRVIVIPDERKRFLRSRTREPMLKELIAKYNWYMITYDDIHAFLSSKHPTMEMLTKRLTGLLDFKLENQSSMHKFLGE
jgi:DNA modification methylase/transposase-like protein